MARKKVEKVEEIVEVVTETPEALPVGDVPDVETPVEVVEVEAPAETVIETPVVKEVKEELAISDMIGTPAIVEVPKAEDTTLETDAAPAKTVGELARKRELPVGETTPVVDPLVGLVQNSGGADVIGAFTV